MSRQTVTENPGRAHGVGVVAAIISTWTFALLPANLVPLIVGELVNRFGVSLDLAGIVATSMTLVNAVVVLSARRVLARGHRRLISAIGLAILIAAYLVAALFPVVPVVLIALVVGGAGSGLLVGAATASLSSMRDPDRTTAIGMIVNRIAVAAVFVVIPLLGGSFEVIMWSLVAVGAITVVLSRRLPPPVAEAPVLAASGEEVREARRGLALLLAIAFAVWTITDEGTYALIQIFVTTNLPTLGAEDLAVLYPGAIATGLLGALAAPFLLKFAGRMPSLCVLFAVSIAGKVLLATGTDPGLVIAAAFAGAFALGAIIPLVFGLAAASKSDGRVSVLVNGLYTLGVGLGPLVSTQVLARSTTLGVGIALASLATAAAIATVIAVVRIDKALGLEHGLSDSPHTPKPEPVTRQKDAGEAPQK